MIRNAVLAGLAFAFFAQPALARGVQKATDTAASEVKPSGDAAPSETEKTVAPAVGNKLQKTKAVASSGPKRVKAAEPASGEALSTGSETGVSVESRQTKQSRRGRASAKADIATTSEASQVVPAETSGGTATGRQAKARKAAGRGGKATKAEASVQSAAQAGSQPALTLALPANGAVADAAEENSSVAVGRKSKSGKEAARRGRKGLVKGGDDEAASAEAALGGPSSSNLDALIAHHAKANGVPEDLVHRIVKRESRYNPRAVGRGGAMGLMQIKHGTARALGYAGPPSGLLTAETNLTYAVKYLAGAYKVANGDHNRAVGYYARGYYYDAKRKGIVASRKKRRIPEREIEEPAAGRVQETASLSSRLFGNPVAAPYADQPK